MFSNKVLLITGGTGSFGNAVLSRFLKTDVKEIRIFSRDEKKQDDMRKKINHDRLKFHLGDVRDSSSLKDVMVGVDYVFHAAALKQVPSCEFYPMEAYKTNVIGTENVINSAITNGVRRLTLLSTDKAVYPINAMGISKAMAEKVLVAKSRAIERSGTTICATRYGNVMASRGSVIPLFREQILSGKSLTVTDPKMTRFLMSLRHSVELVLYSFEHGNQGDIFVQKTPASTLIDLAQAIINRYSGKQDINVIGTRHGEKLHETLVSREEMLKAQDLGNYYRIPSDNRDLNYSRYFSQGEEIDEEVDDYTSENTRRLSVSEIEAMLEEVENDREFVDD